MQEFTLRQWIEEFDKGTFNAKDRATQCEAGWFDWFCKDTSLAAKTKKLAPKVKLIAKSHKIDIDKSYVFFKNNCPLDGSLYDDFRIGDLETGEVIFTVVPACGHSASSGVSEVWGRENNFNAALVDGTWDDVLAFFF